MRNSLMKHSPRKESSTNYSKKLKDPRWQRKRLEVLQRDGWTCQSCRDKTATLHVHHKEYRHGDPWDIPLSCLITLCEICHEEESFERAKMEQNLLQVLKKAVNINQLAVIADFYEKQNEYFYLLNDEKWAAREKSIFGDSSACFICNTTEDLTVYHKTPSYHEFGKKPWELPDSEFDFICKSCSCKNEGPYINISEYLEFLLPAFHHAGYCSEDIIDMVSNDYLNKFIKLVLEEIRKTRMNAIPSQFSDDWVFRKNITYEQLCSLLQEANRETKESKLITLEVKNE